MTQNVCLITGVGPGTGSALARRFAEGYQVAMLARNSERLAALESEIEDARAFPCDVREPIALRACYEKVVAEMGAPSVILHNAVGGAFGDFLSIEPAVLQRNFEINTLALLHLARLAAPAMIEAGRGAILCTGNTSTYRGKANFAGFAPTFVGSLATTRASFPTPWSMPCRRPSPRVEGRSSFTQSRPFKTRWDGS